VDTDHQADEAWILSVQRKLYQWSKANPEDVWRDMWGWLTDLRMLRHAWRRVASNRGRRSAAVDGMTVARIRNRIGEQRFLEGLQAELRRGAYWPSPSRRKTTIVAMARKLLVALWKYVTAGVVIEGATMKAASR
jgi:RNA-directed DNA polymerase